MTLPPHIFAYRDRHGRTRYRFRARGLPTRSIPGNPGEPRFEAAYAEAKRGETRRTKYAPRPRTLSGAWEEVRRSVDWTRLKPISQKAQIRIAERFLLRPISAGASLTMGELPIATMRRADVKHILALYADRATAGIHVLKLLRKLCLAALDLGWIEIDPTHRVIFRPHIIGHRSWTDDELAAFEARWPVGSRERLAYALALYTGQRRADLAVMPWTAYDGNGIAIVQSKTGSALWVPVHPELKAILDATDRSGATILVTQWGRAFGVDGLGHMMAAAIAEAGLNGCRMHGLRKSAGRCLAEAGATTRQIMAVLGHKSITEAERYTRGAEQRSLAQQGIDQWSRPKLKVIEGGK